MHILNGSAHEQLYVLSYTDNIASNSNIAMLVVVKFLAGLSSLLRTVVSLLQSVASAYLYDELPVLHVSLPGRHVPSWDHRMVGREAADRRTGLSDRPRLVPADAVAWFLAGAGLLPFSPFTARARTIRRHAQSIDYIICTLSSSSLSNPAVTAFFFAFNCACKFMGYRRRRSSMHVMLAPPFPSEI